MHLHISSAGFTSSDSKDSQNLHYTAISRIDIEYKEQEISKLTLERIPQCPMHLIANILNRTITPNNQSLVKLGLFTAPLGVDAHQI